MDRDREFVYMDTDINTPTLRDWDDDEDDLSSVRSARLEKFDRRAAKRSRQAVSKDAKKRVKGFQRVSKEDRNNNRY